MQSRHPYIIKKNNLTAQYYRFVVYPIHPQARYSIRDGELRFIAKAKTIDETSCSRGLEQWVTNEFNIQAVIAKDFNEMRTIAKKRHYNQLHLDGTALIVDINKNYFDQATVYKKPYAEGPCKPFFPWVETNREFGCFSSQAFFVTGPAYKANFPVFSQTKYTMASSGFFCAYAKYIDVVPHVEPNPLHEKVNGTTRARMEVWEYETKDADFGKDIFIPKEYVGATVSYRRRLHGLTDWCSHLQPEMNQEAYLDLTKGITGERGNAKKIANLFADHANKGGKNLTGFFHCHFFRHDQTIRKAQEIADELERPEHNNDYNEDVAIYLAEKFKSLAPEGFKVNLHGSFARRINYAILQLSNGFCHNVDDFDCYLAQKMQRHRQIASPGKK